MPFTVRRADLAAYQIEQSRIKALDAEITAGERAHERNRLSNEVAKHNAAIADFERANDLHRAYGNQRKS
ncbi:MAG: hypothetical protein ACREE2_14350 [Stellaceae bacterium]